MREKKQLQKVLGVMMMLLLLIGMVPGVALGAPIPQQLGWQDFLSSENSVFVAGETSSITVRLKDVLTGNPYSGTVTASIIDPDDNEYSCSISGSAGNYTISNLTLDTVGGYSLIIRPTSTIDSGAASWTIIVLNAVTTVTGSLIINTNNTLSVKVTDSVGDPLARKSVTVDGTSVGAGSQSYQTLYDGTFKFSMTPSLLGTVNISYSGHVIGTITVLPAYTQNARIGGTSVDNVSLAISIAKNGWATGSRTVILARDDEFADAMAAVPLAKKFNAPILMTGSATLDDRTLAEMWDLGVYSIYIVGGTGVISQAVEYSLRSYGFTTTRIAGQERHDTAAKISSAVGVNATHTVYLANGYAIPDAVAASAFAAQSGIPILLTDRDQLPPSTIQALTNLNASNLVLLGGEGVISTNLENELRSTYGVKRWGGQDRYDTQYIIFQNLLNTTTPQSPLYFASGLVRQDDVSSGKPNADALLTAALAAKNGGFVAMIPPNTLPSSLNYFLLFNKGYISKAAVVGDDGAVSRNLEQQLHGMLSR